MGRNLLVLLLIAALLLAACGGSDDEAEPASEPAAVEESMSAGESMDSLPEVNPLEVTGDIITAGSSTVFPLSEAMAERFRDEGYPDNITIDSIGSGAGFERFCVAGESDVSNASRPIKDSERESCAAIDRIPIEFRVGTDALAVTVSKENDFVDNLTMEQLALAFSTAVTWADVDPEWPDEPIQRFSPGTDSGTFDYFVEEVFDKDKEPILRADAIQLSEDDNVLVQGVTGSPLRYRLLRLCLLPGKCRSAEDRRHQRRPGNRRKRRQRHLPARQAAVHLLGRRHNCRETAGRRLHQLLSDLRQRRDRTRRLLPGRSLRARSRQREPVERDERE